MRGGLSEFGADLVRWWAWETGLSGAGAVRGAAARLHLSREGVLVEPRTGEARRAAPSEAGAALRDMLGSRRPARVELVVAADRHLLRRLSPLRLPRSRVLAMARLDRAQATPFGAEDCHLVLPLPRAEDPGSLYALLRRDQLDPLLEGLRAARLSLAALVLETPEGRLRVDGPSLRALDPPRGPARALRAGRRAAALVALAGLLALPATIAWRQEAALAAIEGDLALAEEQAGRVRADMRARQERIGRLAALRDARSGAVPLVRVLEELAGTLPDGTWLDRVDLEGGRIVLSGISADAAGLIPRLAAAPLFRDPVFVQPVVREAGRGERFAIALETGSADG